MTCFYYDVCRVKERWSVLFFRNCVYVIIVLIEMKFLCLWVLCCHYLYCIKLTKVVPNELSLLNLLLLSIVLVEYDCVNSSQFHKMFFFCFIYWCLTKKLLEAKIFVKLKISLNFLWCSAKTLYFYWQKKKSKWEYYAENLFW